MNCTDIAEKYTARVHRYALHSIGTAVYIGYLCKQAHSIRTQDTWLCKATVSCACMYAHIHIVQRHASKHIHERVYSEIAYFHHSRAEQYFNSKPCWIIRPLLKVFKQSNDKASQVADLFRAAVKVFRNHNVQAL